MLSDVFDIKKKSIRKEMPLERVPDGFLEIKINSRIIQEVKHIEELNDFVEVIQEALAIAVEKFPEKFLVSEDRLVFHAESGHVRAEFFFAIDPDYKQKEESEKSSD